MILRVLLSIVPQKIDDMLTGRTHRSRSGEEEDVDEEDTLPRLDECCANGLLLG